MKISVEAAIQTFYGVGLIPNFGRKKKFIRMRFPWKKLRAQLEEDENGHFLSTNSLQIKV